MHGFDNSLKILAIIIKNSTNKSFRCIQTIKKRGPRRVPGRHSDVLRQRAAPRTERPALVRPPLTRLLHLRRARPSRQAVLHLRRLHRVSGLRQAQGVRPQEDAADRHVRRVERRILSFGGD